MAGLPFKESSEFEFCNPSESASTTTQTLWCGHHSHSERGKLVNSCFISGVLRETAVSKCRLYRVASRVTVLIRRRSCCEAWFTALLNRDSGVSRPRRGRSETIDAAPMERVESAAGIGRPLSAHARQATWHQEAKPGCDPTRCQQRLTRVQSALC